MGIKQMPRDLKEAIIGVCIPPVLVYQKKNMGNEFFVDLLLWFFTWSLGIIYAFHMAGVEPLINILCLYIPPLGYYLSRKTIDCDFFICLIGWILAGFVGFIWAYHKA